MALNTFIKDEEKMRDFVKLSKEAFLKTYSYLTEKEYRETSILFTIQEWNQANFTDKEALSILLNLIKDDEVELYKKVMNSTCMENYTSNDKCIEMVRDAYINKKSHYDVWINEDKKQGYFEHKIYGDEQGGGLWFRDGVLVDYDGVYVLPKEVIQEVEVLGFIVEETMKSA